MPETMWGISFKSSTLGVVLRQGLSLNLNLFQNDYTIGDLSSSTHWKCNPAAELQGNQYPFLASLGVCAHTVFKKNKQMKHSGAALQSLLRQELTEGLRPEEVAEILPPTKLPISQAQSLRLAPAPIL